MGEFSLPSLNNLTGPKALKGQAPLPPPPSFLLIFGRPVKQTRGAYYDHHITASFKRFFIQRYFQNLRKPWTPWIQNCYAGNTSVAAFGGREEPFYMRGDMLRAISSLLPLLFFADSLSTPLTHINF